jgi:hypothetical protein
MFSILKTLIAIVIGVVLSWTAFSLQLSLIVFAMGQHPFGFPEKRFELIYTLNICLAWIPLCSLSGSLIGWFMRRNPVVYSAIAAVAAIASLIIPVYDWSLQRGLSATDFIQDTQIMFRLSATLLMVLLPLSAYGVSRINRSNTAVNSEPPSATLLP